MSEKKELDCEFKVDDRVARSNGTGTLGTVVSVHADVTSPADEKEKGIVIGVQWDSGTKSFFSPEGLSEAKK